MDHALADADAGSDLLRRAEAVERRAFMLRTLGRDEEAVSQLREALPAATRQPVTTIHAVVLASLANSLMRIDDPKRRTTWRGRRRADRRHGRRHRAAGRRA